MFVLGGEIALQKGRHERFLPCPAILKEGSKPTPLPRRQLALPNQRGSSGGAARAMPCALMRSTSPNPCAAEPGAHPFRQLETS